MNFPGRALRLHVAVPVRAKAGYSIVGQVAIFESGSGSGSSRRSHLGRVLATIATALIATACGSAAETPSDQVEPGRSTSVAALKGHTTGHVSVDGTSIVQGPNAFLVDFDPSETQLTNASALMPSHGHGSPKPASIAQTDTGYRVSDMILSMPGLWNVFLDVQVGDTPDRVEFSVDVP